MNAREGESNGSGTSSGQQAEVLELAQPEIAAADSAALTAPTNRALWMEVAAVLAVAVIPQVMTAVLALHVRPGAPLPYWLDSVDLMVVSACTIFVTLYIISRSSEPWQNFGLSRIRLWDWPLGLLVFIVLQIVLVSCIWPFLLDGRSRDYGIPLPRPGKAVDYLLMVPKYGIAAFAEELVTRAYLISRFERLLNSRLTAVALAAALFASYHAYQGPDGLLLVLPFGIVCGLAYLMIRRIWPLAIAHAIYNIRIDLIA